MPKSVPEHDINLHQRGDEWYWQLRNHGSAEALVEGVTDTAEEAHLYAYAASIWLSKPEDEGDWL